MQWFFFLQTSTLFFPLCFERTVASFQDDIDMIEVIVLQFMSLQCVILCFKNFIKENIAKIVFSILCRFSSLIILKLIPAKLRSCFDENRSSPSEVFLRKGFLKICIIFTGKHPCRSAFSIKLHLKVLIKYYFF